MWVLAKKCSWPVSAFVPCGLSFSVLPGIVHACPLQTLSILFATRSSKLSSGSSSSMRVLKSGMTGPASVKRLREEFDGSDRGKLHHQSSPNSA